MEHVLIEIDMNISQKGKKEHEEFDRFSEQGGTDISACVLFEVFEHISI